MLLKLFTRNYNKITRIFRAILPFSALVTVFILFHYTKLQILKYYPVCMNFTFFITFFLSLFGKETVIQKIAKAIKSELKPIELEYTRKLTYVWTGFCFINFLISFATVYMSEQVWVIYNGVISYILVGLMFVVEYIVRINFKKKHGI